jgi:NlpC/P60 family putative phage cell wall peptidase
MSLSELCERSSVVAEARKWIGTPYHHQADALGSGVDCGMLLVRVFVDTGLCEPFDPRPYADDWMLHRSEEKYLKFVFDRTKEVKSPQPGDVMVFRQGRCYSHGGIVTCANPVTIIHAFKAAKRVVEEEVSASFMLSNPCRLPRYFSYWARD